MHLSNSVSSPESPLRNPPFIAACLFFARIPFLALAATFAFASVLSAGPQSQRSFLSQSSSCQSTHATSFAPSLFLPANLAAFTPSDRPSCASNHSALALAMQSSADPAKTRSRSGNISIQPKVQVSEHRLWDRENVFLFAAVGASRALDYSSTLNFRRRGRNEVFLNNDIVDNHPAFAAIEAGAAAVSIGVSYLFHRTHHHRLERWTSIVHASLATAGAVRNYSLKTPQSSSAP